MARDPQQLRKAYEYKLGKDLADKLSDAHIASLSNYYNRASSEEQSKIDSELIKGMGDFLDSARDLAKEGFIRDSKLPIQKYQPEDLSEVKAKEDAFQKYQPEDKAKDDFVESVDKKLDEKLSETSDSIMSEIDKLIAEYQKKVDDYKKPKEEEEKVPEGLEALLNDIKSEVGGDTPKKGGALAVVPKPDKVKEETLIGDENIDPEILKALGLNDVTDLDYGEYSSLLKEKMMANQMGSGGGLDQEKLKDEYKRVKGKTGSFKVKSKKISAQSFVAKTKPSSTAVSVTPKLPPAPQEEVTQVVDSKRQSTDKTFALIASKLETVDRNVKETAVYLTKKDNAEKKEKDAAKKEAQDVATAERENKTENRNIFAAIPGVVGAAVKPIKDALSGFFDGLKRLGFAIFIMELMRFLKDPAKYINDIIDWTNKQIEKLETSIENFVIDKMVKPMNGMIKNLNSKITDFVGIINPLLEKLSLLGIKPIDTNSLKIPEIKENDIRNGIALPQVPNVNDNFLDSIKLGDSDEVTDTDTEGGGENNTTRVEPQETLMGDQKPNKGAKGLLNFISKGEGGYNSMNQGTQGNRIVGSTHDAGSKLGKDLTKMTIGEVMERQAYLMNPSNPQVGDYGIFAAGRYQIIPSTMKEILPKSGLKKSDMFNQENQDILGMTLISKKQPRVEDYLKGGGSIEGAMDALSDEFASMPDPRSGNSKYGAGNRALHSVEEVREALQNARRGYSTEEPKPTSSETTRPQTVPMDQIPGENATQEEKDEYFRRLDAGELTPTPSSVEPLLPPTKEQQQLKSEEQRKRTEELMKGDPRFTPQVSVPVITPPVQKASLTTIGGAGSQGPQSPTSAAAATQSQLVAFSASDPTNLSVMAAKSVYGVVG